MSEMDKMSTRLSDNEEEMTDSQLDQELGIINATSTTGLTDEIGNAQLEVKTSN